jgi:hypothetical protein
LEDAVTAALCTGGYTRDTGDTTEWLCTQFTVEVEGGGRKDKGQGKSHLQEETFSVVLTHNLKELEWGL